MLKEKREAERQSLRAIQKKKKIVFKPVLESPFSIPWPTVAPPRQTLYCQTLQALLSPLVERADKLYTTTKEINKKTHGHAQKRARALQDARNALPDSVRARLAILDEHVLIGNAAVTRYLQSKEHNGPPLAMVIICRGDLRPCPPLYEHLPYLLHDYNITKDSARLWAPLQTGFEAEMAKMVGLARCSVLALLEHELFRPLLDLVKQDLPQAFTIPRLRDPLQTLFKPTLISQIKTLAPATKQRMTRSQKKRLCVLNKAKKDATKAHERRLETRRRTKAAKSAVMSSKARSTIDARTA